jgi:hypothetical protein
VRGANRGIGHNRSRVLEEVTDIAVLVAGRPNRAEIQLIFVVEILIKLVAKVSCSPWESSHQ